MELKINKSPVKKDKLVPMASNESLGDKVTHFMKSGSCYRPDHQRDALLKFKQRVIPEWREGVRFEYDVWFNTNELFTIRKWLYTDFLGRGIYVKTNSIKINDKLMISIAKSDIEIDEERIEKILNCIEDKYILAQTQEHYDKVIFPPGSNLICKERVIHWGRMQDYIKQGYVIKPHPITNALYMAKFKKDFGADKVLNKKQSGHEILYNCKEVATMPNSEMGIVALLLNKKLGMISHTKKEREKNLVTYESIYHAVSGTKASHTIRKILSAKNSGIIFDFDDDAEERLERFINNFWEYKKQDD